MLARRTDNTAGTADYKAEICIIFQTFGRQKRLTVVLIFRQESIIMKG